MEPSLPESFELWKWVAGIVVSAVAGAVSAAMTVSRVIFKIDTALNEINLVKRVIFKETGGLNLMTETRHTEICVPHTAMMEQDLEHLKDQLAEVNSKLDIVIGGTYLAQKQTSELERVSGLMSEINKKFKGCTNVRS